MDADQNQAIRAAQLLQDLVGHAADGTADIRAVHEHRGV